MRRSVGVKVAAEHTSIELIARDRSGFLSELFAVLKELKCFVVVAEHTAIELTARDRLGLLSEVFAVLTYLKWYVRALEDDLVFFLEIIKLSFNSDIVG